MHRICALALLLATTACGSGREDAGSILTQPAAPSANSAAIALIREAAVPLTGADADYDSLLAMVGDADFVLLGEQTHGTHEFYRERSRITQRLVREKSFRIITLEADWPDALRVNRYINGEGRDANATQALAGFSRFPRWMWRNQEMRELVEWLRAFNLQQPPDDRVQLFGMDVYSGFASAREVLDHLGRTDTALARAASARYACFKRFGTSAEEYARAFVQQQTASCATQVAEQLNVLQQLFTARTDNRDAGLLAALQSARIVRNAEEYYRLAFRGGIEAWNLRDQHMVETIEALVAWHTRFGGTGKVVSWAHNSHMGDARMTERGEVGELNVGQLMRQRHPQETVIVGFTTYEGTVLAASDWGAAGAAQRLRPALPESFAALFHAVNIPAFYLPLKGTAAVAQALSSPRIERAVGVVYAPHTERQSHYFAARLGQQFDAVIHFDRTRAVTPL